MPGCHCERHVRAGGCSQAAPILGLPVLTRQGRDSGDSALRGPPRLQRHGWEGRIGQDWKGAGGLVDHRDFPVQISSAFFLGNPTNVQGWRPQTTVRLFLW